MILFLSAVLGFASGALGPLLPDIIENIVSRQRLGIGYGIVYIFEGLGCVLGPPAAGQSVCTRTQNQNEQLIHCTGLG